MLGHPVPQPKWDTEPAFTDEDHMAQCLNAMQIYTQATAVVHAAFKAAMIITFIKTNVH